MQQKFDYQEKNIDKNCYQMKYYGEAQATLMCQSDSQYDE